MFAPGISWDIIRGLTHDNSFQITVYCTANYTAGLVKTFLFLELMGQVAILSIFLKVFTNLVFSSF